MDLLPLRVRHDVTKGEGPGHTFRGNQHTGGIPGDGLAHEHVGPFQPAWFQSGATSDAMIHATHRIVDNIDVDLMIAQNPPKPGEKLFQWQSRMVGLLDAQTKNDVLNVCREKYPPVDYIAQGAAQWREMHHLPQPQADIGSQTVDLDKAAAVARYFDTTPDQSSDPAVARAYEDFKRQNEAQWKFATSPVSEGGLGIKVTFSPFDRGDPYPSAEAQAEDLRRNHHITTQSDLGGAHQGTMTNEEYNRFRAVHDIFGHAGVGRGFDRHGEYDAWLQHMTMYTGLGRNAMTSEYHGVNSSLWDSASQGLKYAGTGKSILLPPQLLRDPWDSHGHLVRKDIGHTDPAVIDYLVRRLHLGPEFAAQYENGPWHGGARVSKGEQPGHPFRGNQYVTGESGGAGSENGIKGSGKEKPLNGGTFWPTTGNNDEVHHSPTHRGKLITDNVDAAAQALAQGIAVELRQPREISTLLDRLASLVKDAESKGQAAPNYNLCQVSVAGTNVFCAGNKGIARDLMPQLAGIARPGSKADALPKTSDGGPDLTQQFVDALRAQGTKVTNDIESAAYLRATQNELVGAKVAGIAGALRAGGAKAEHIRSGSIFVSKDNYIIDGHHRWAGMVGVDASDNHLGDEKIHIKRIDMPITQILAFANKFTDEWGIQRKSGKAGGKVKKTHTLMRHLLPIRVAKGEQGGHPFRGNQYRTGESGMHAEWNERQHQGATDPQSVARGIKGDSIGPFSDKGIAAAQSKANQAVLIDRLLEASIEKGGFTVDSVTGKDIANGFAVAVPDKSSAIIPADTFATTGHDAIRAYLRQVRDVAKQNQQVKFGGWFDKAHNEVVLDHVEVFPPTAKAAAITAGRQRDQQAIFDLGKMAEIPTGGTGGRSEPSPAQPAIPESKRRVGKSLLPIALGGSDW